MEEPVVVDAEVIDAQLGALSKAEKWLAGARGRVAELAAQYKVPESIEGDRAYKDAKESRASVRRDAAEIDAERKRMTREMDDALKRFRRDVKDVLGPLADLDAAYKSALDEYEARWGAERRAELQAAYDEYAPDLVPLVPLDRLVARFGTERGKGWLNRSTNVEAAKAGLRGAVDGIAAGEQTIAKSVDAADLEAAKADYFMTLDLSRAIADAQARAEQRERVRRLEEERRAREVEQQRAAEAARDAETAQIGPQSQEPDPTPANGTTAPKIGSQRLVDTGAVVSREEAAALWEQTTPGMPKPGIVEQVAIATGTPEPGRVPEYVFCGYGTKAQAEAFAEFCRRSGVGRFVKVPTHGRQYKLSTR